LREKIERICRSFNDQFFEINRMNVDEQLQDAEAMKSEIKAGIQTLRSGLKNYIKEVNVFREQDVSLIQFFKWFVIKEKSLYKVLNLGRKQGSMIYQLFWCPESEWEKVWNHFENMPSSVTMDAPRFREMDTEDVLAEPTQFSINEFTAPFQEIVSTYGVPIYKEANPTVFTIITFPFMFGIMFGDIMHGALLFLFAAVICFFPKAFESSGLTSARYLLLMMGFYATYAGFIYNDMTSIPLTIFSGSCYNVVGTEGEQKEDCVFPFGIDPIWFRARNELQYVNSLKMKLSVIFGVAQMAIGIILKAYNAVFFKRFSEVLFEFIPQILLLTALFGFMDFLIIAKWSTNWYANPNAQPPSIITNMINMFLGGGKVEGDPMIPEQQATMQFLVTLALVCIPVLLMVKPIIEIMSLKKHEKVEGEQVEEGRTAINDEEDEAYQNAKFELQQKPAALGKELEEALPQECKKAKAPHSVQDIFIHQLIETIEFVLGTVSNTASYLRLWALSLAHSQLAKVFFDMTITLGLKANSAVLVRVLPANRIAFHHFLRIPFLHPGRADAHGPHGSLPAHPQAALG